MASNDKPIRQNSLLGSWGVGAIVPFPNNETLMVAGLSQWRFGKKPGAFIIDEPRLTKRMHCRELRRPPEYLTRSDDPYNCGLSIPFVRFPRWYYCPYCGKLKQVTDSAEVPMCNGYPWPDKRIHEAKDKPIKMIPERFVVMCTEGHISDFPIAEWVHSGSGHVYDPQTCVMRRSVGGNSSSLGSLNYTCTCGAHKSMREAMRKGALAGIGFKCKGSKPWLRIDEDRENPCGTNPMDLCVTLAGATNVWFADIRSSIFIPTGKDKETDEINRILNDDNAMRSLLGGAVNGDISRPLLEYIASTHNVDPDHLYKAIINRDGDKSDTDTEEENEEDQFRFQEYSVLRTTNNDMEEFESVNKPITAYDKSIQEFFDSISLVPRLRETRAFNGFSRVKPRSLSFAERRKLLWGNKPEEWLPAIEDYGEGIFFEFNSKKLSEWAKSKDVVDRIGTLNNAFHISQYCSDVTDNLRPEFIMIHTFAHLLINQLSFDCGYGSSSLRERLYCSETSDELPMAGVLIYTSSGDSEGSLGGLVRMGNPGRLEQVIENAMVNALWCSADPVCIQSKGQGTDSLNLAACHNCALLPETCCEYGNKLLDRGVVIGTLDNPDMGFFSKYRYSENEQG